MHKHWLIVCLLLLCMCAGMFAACSGGIGSSWLPQGAEEKGVTFWQLNVAEHAVTRCILRTDDGTAYDYTPKGGITEKTETVQAADTKLAAGQLPALAQAADIFLKENDSSGKKAICSALWNRAMPSRIIPKRLRWAKPPYTPYRRGKSPPLKRRIIPAPGLMAWSSRS